MSHYSELHAEKEYIAKLTDTFSYTETQSFVEIEGVKYTVEYIKKLIDQDKLQNPEIYI